VEQEKTLKWKKLLLPPLAKNINNKYQAVRMRIGINLRERRNR
jgi:hypothetical protein